MTRARRGPAIEISAGRFQASTFLKLYWQRRALVIRGLFASWNDSFGPDDYAGLACRSDVDSRLVVTGEGRNGWRVRRGPQSARALRRLPRRGWTLLVEGAEQVHRRLLLLRRPFRFIPEWRFDDVMVSLAPPGGSVGAHVDSYDVFLIQGRGRRLWEVDSRAGDDCWPGLPLRVLRRFAPRRSERFILEPGDVLYVPPGLAHRGTTERSDDPVAVTYSVGFRAPTHGALAAATAAHLLAREAESDRPRLFSDPGRLPARGGGVEGGDVARLRAAVREALENLSEDDWRKIAGSALGGRRPEAARRS
jgi:50S ribosomal protein L16 3-hydroxylase